MKHAQLFDAAERIILLTLYFFLLARVMIGFAAHANLISLLLVLSEGFVVVFVLLRRSTQNISQKPRDWLMALGGTVAPLLVDTSEGGVLAPIGFLIVMMLAGIFLQLAAKLTLGRRFGVVPANRGVTVAGPYRLLRHPMYAGYLLTHIAYFLGHASLWNAAIYLVEAAFQIARIKAEEALLAEDAGYRSFRDRVRYRLLPGVF